MIPDVGV